jgi:fructuronate reductase
MRRLVHIGPGAFHRVHQAWYAQAWLARDPRWGIAAVSLHSAALRDALAGQDWLYTLAELDDEVSFEVVGSLCEARVAHESPSAVLERIASPTTRLITLTVTEKGYCLDGEGRLDLEHPDVRHDRDNPATPTSTVGLLVAGLARRRERGLHGVPVLSCDNLSGNGRVLAAALATFAQQRAPGLADWIAAEVPCPCTMVDSITPATSPELRRQVTEVLGLDDRWPVQRERFVQWVIEAHDARESPDWAAAGVIVTDDVSGYERAKLRILNGAHSTLAYHGLLRGHETVAGAMQDPSLVALVRSLVVEEVLPTLQPVRGLDYGDYLASVLRRFRNPALRHELAQIAWDGSQKLPIRLLGTVRDALAAGRSVTRLSGTIAAWMLFVRLRALAGIALVDPLAERLSRLAREQTSGDAVCDVAAFLTLESVFPRDLAATPAFREALVSSYAALAALPGPSVT